jgi:hypothetical protein
MFPDPEQGTKKLLIEILTEVKKSHWSVMPSFWLLVLSVIISLVGVFLSLPKEQKSLLSEVTIQNTTSEKQQKLSQVSEKIVKPEKKESTNNKSEERIILDIEVRNDIAYAPNEATPFTGRYETYYPNGTKKGVANIKNGKYDGLMTLWDENGIKSYEKIIKNGVELPVNEDKKVEQSTGGFGSFRSEAETAKKELQCPNSVDSDITPALYDGAGDLYGCIQGKMETVKWFINEIPKSNQVRNVKFLWNDWFKDMGFGIHSDQEEAKKALKVIIKLYAPEKSKEVYNAFFGNTSKTITSTKFILEYTYDRGPAIDERMIIVTEK